MTAPTNKVSVKLALLSLSEQVDETREARERYMEAMELRNKLICDARRSGVASKVIERITGLSRDRIARIAASGSWSHSDS